MWSDPVKITRVISPQNVEVELKNNKKKIVNINNIKKFEGNVDFSGERIRNTNYTTRYGRISKPVVNQPCN